MTENNPYDEMMPVETAQDNNALVDVEQSRAVAEVQSAMTIAKRFPRNEKNAMDRILTACTRPTLAESAVYTYGRGGTEVSGPTIRLAEALAQAWGNMQFGIRELSQANGESTVEAYAWDIENNTRQVKTFQVPHTRYTRAKGNTRLVDPRDIYEKVANQGARRLRACILGIIPGDVVEAALRQCEATMSIKAEVTPERIQSLLEKFGQYNVTKEMIEARIQRRIEAMTPALMVQLGKIWNSLRDGMSSTSDWFKPETSDDKPKGLAEKLAEKAAEMKANDPKPPVDDPEPPTPPAKKKAPVAEKKKAPAPEQPAQADEPGPPEYTGEGLPGVPLSELGKEKVFPPAPPKKADQKPPVLCPAQKKGVYPGECLDCDTRKTEGCDAYDEYLFELAQAGE